MSDPQEHRSRLNMTMDFLRKNRRTVLSILLLPAMTVVLALILIALLRPTRLLPIVIAVGAVLAQYLLLVIHIWRRLKTEQVPVTDESLLGLSSESSGIY